MGYTYRKTVQYHETDAMGVVHHSNYLRYFEEARCGWLLEKGLQKEHSPHADLTFAVLETSCRHLLPCRFGDQLSIRVQVKQEGAKLRFQYAAYLGEGQLVATGTTLHIAINDRFQICRLRGKIKETLEKEEWTEIWP